MSPGATSSGKQSGKKFVEIPLCDKSARHSQNKNGCKQPVEHFDEEEERTTNLRRHCCKFFHFLDVLGKRLRHKTHRFFYKLGLKIQKHYWKILLLSFVTLAVPCLFGLVHLKVEDDIEKLWVASEGRLRDEIRYTEKMVGSLGYGEATIESEVILQVLKDENKNILTSKNLLYHLEVMEEIMNLKVDYQDESWGFGDFCIKYEIPHMELLKEQFELAEIISPCIISTPLDCFWEGSKVKPPEQKTNYFSWQRDRPSDFVSQLIRDYPDWISPTIAEYLKEIGANEGYVGKPCLDPNCPNSFKTNTKKITSLDIGQILTNGCFGVATRHMHWPEGAIMSHVTRNKSTGYINSAKALQTIIYITNPDDFLRSLPYEKRRVMFTKTMANDILTKWKVAVTKIVKDRQSTNANSDTTIMAFSTESFYNLVKDFSDFEAKKLGIGIGVISGYSFLTLKRWTTSIYSYGFMGILGPIFVCYSIAAGYGFAQFLGFKLSVLSTEVLPFLALAIGFDSMFLLLRTYVCVCDSGQISQNKIIAVVLGDCGLSLTITTITNISCFVLASLIPIVALKEFCFQAAMLVFVMWFMLLFTLTPLLSADIERQVLKRTDCFCMKKYVEAEFFFVFFFLLFADLHFPWKLGNQGTAFHRSPW